MVKRKPSDLVTSAAAEETSMSMAKAARAVASWKHKHKEAVAEAIALEQRLEALLSISGDIPKRRLSKAKATKGEGVAAIIPATDWHVEEVITAAGTNGKNAFNLTEAGARIERFYQKSVRLIDHHSSLARVSEIWHPLLGDLLTGYIHEELMETNSLSPTEACVFLQERICAGIDFLLHETKLPVFVPTCVGNHGRTTIKKRIKTSHRNSYEWLLYKTLERHYATNPRVRFFVGEGYHNTQTIVGRKVRFHHGDGLRYMGGVGGISIPVNKSIAQWDKVDPADLDVFGHWHTFLAHYPKWVSCGSLMGYSEYSVEIKAEFQHPTQTFIVVDRQYGMTHAIPILLTPAKRQQQR